MEHPFPWPRTADELVVLRRPVRRRRPAATTICPIDCDCSKHQQPLTGAEIAIRALIGVGLGLALAQVHDWWTGGQGLLAVFGGWA